MQTKGLIKTFTNSRNYFPMLRDHAKDLYLFDNSAGAQVPHFVTDKVQDFFHTKNAQKGTLFHRTEWMQQTIIEGRQQAAELIGAKDHTEIAFGLNATSFFALFAHHLGRDLKAGDRIIITESEHQANVSPWMELEERGIHIDISKVNEDGSLNFEHYEQLLTLSPKIVAVGWISNATGTIHDIKKISKMAHDAGALVVVDGVQKASHAPVDVKEADIDFAAFSTYKIFGPHMGFAYINRERMERLSGYRLAHMIEKDSYKFELGTQNHEGIIAFLGSMDYLAQLNKDAISNGLSLDDVPVPQNASERRKELFAAMYWAQEYEKHLSQYFLNKISDYAQVELYGYRSLEQSDLRVPVFAFNVEGWETDHLGKHLNEVGIEARTGDYLAINLIKKLAHRFGGSALRISLVHYNLTSELDYLFESLERVALKRV